ncbi:MAG: hypothetical protein AB8G18_09730 [Gammaproteobacteria bacterium]
MNDNQKRISDDLSTDDGVDSIASSQLPEWHPFAVWKSQIRQDQSTATGQHRILQSVKVADA